MIEDPDIAPDDPRPPSLLMQLARLIENSGNGVPSAEALIALEDQARAASADGTAYSRIDCALVIAYRQLRRAMDNGDPYAAEELWKIVQQIQRVGERLTEFPDA